MRRLLILLAILLLWGGTLFMRSELQQKVDAVGSKKVRVSAVITSPEVIPYLLGYETVFADYLWIKTMLYFGESFTTGKDFEWLTSMIDAVTMLNPGFYPAYEFGGVVVPQVTDNHDYPRLLLDRGISRVNERREFLMFLNAWSSYDIYQDYERAADLMELASHWDKAPPFWSSWAASVRQESGDAPQSIAFLQQMFLNSNNPSVLTTLLDKIIELQGEQQGVTTIKGLYSQTQDPQAKEIIVTKLEDILEPASTETP